MALKDDLKTDLSTVFFDNDDFSEVIVVNGLTVNAIVDREKRLFESGGNYFYLITAHLKNEDFTAAPLKRGQTANIDGEVWLIELIDYSDSFVSVVDFRSQEAYKHGLF